MSLKPMEKLVLLAMVEHAPRISPSISRLEQMTGLSRRSVIDQLKALESRGLLVVDRTTGERSSYYLSLNRCILCMGQSEPVQEVHPTGAGGALVPVQEVHPKKEIQEEKQEAQTESESDQSRAHLHLHDPMRARHELGDPADEPAVVYLLDVWEDVYSTRPRLRGGLNDPRTRAILERLDEGATRGELEQAIRGSRNDDWIAKKKGLQSLATVLADANRVERYANLVDGAEVTPPEQLTGLARAHWEALQGQRGPEAMALAKAHREPREWFYAMQEVGR